MSLEDLSLYSQTIPAQHTPPSLPIIKRIPTKRTRTRPTTPKPLKQTPPMKQMPTSLTPLIRDLAITPDDTIANRAFRLSLHRTFHIPFKRRKRIDQAAVENIYRAK